MSVFGIGWTAGAVVELLRPIALQDQMAAGRQRTHDAVEDLLPERRRCKLDEDGGAAMDALIDRVSIQAADGRCAAVISALHPAHEAG